MAKKSKKVIGVSFSDLHSHNWTRFSENYTRLMSTLDVLRVISKVSEQNGKVPVFFSGDLFHEPEKLENKVITASLMMYDRYFERKGINMYAIDGNHDQAKQNFLDNPSPHYLEGFKVFKSFHYLGYRKPIKIPNSNIMVSGIPYFKHNRGLEKEIKRLRRYVEEGKINILLTHLDMPGSVYPNGEPVPASENLSPKLVKKFGIWDLVLNGHIHKPMQVTQNIYNIGAPQQQRADDIGCKMGYWLIYEDGSMKFVHLSQYPVFKVIEWNEEPEDSFNFYLQQPKPVEEAKITKRNLSNLASKSKVAKTYCKNQGIKSKRKVNKLIQVIKDAEQ